MVSPPEQSSAQTSTNNALLAKCLTLEEGKKGLQEDKKGLQEDIKGLQDDKKGLQDDLNIQAQAFERWTIYWDQLVKYDHAVARRLQELNQRLVEVRADLDEIYRLQYEEESTLSANSPPSLQDMPWEPELNTVVEGQNLYPTLFPGSNTGDGEDFEDIGKPVEDLETPETVGISVPDRMN